MSQKKNKANALRWLVTAREDLQAAESLYSGEFFKQTCFYCQQSGEKALKSLWIYYDKEPWGHSLLKLIDDFSNKDIFKDIEKIIEAAIILDKYYLSARYPDSFPEEIPGNSIGVLFQSKDSEGALVAAKLLLNSVEQMEEF